MPKRFGVSLSMSALLSIRGDRSFKSSSRPARLMLAVLGGFVLMGLWLFVIARAQSSAQAAPTFQLCNAGPAVIARTHSSTGTPPNDVITAASDPLCIKTDLRVTKTVNNATPEVGEAITYTVVVINGGPDNATGVQLTDVLPTGVTFGSATPQDVCIEEDNAITCDLGHLPNGDSAIVTIVVTPTKAGTITNVASVTGNESDPDRSNNTAEKSVRVIGADLVVTKTVNITAPKAGDVITYTITVANNGPDEATGVQVIDVLPKEVAFDGYTATRGTYITTTGLWNVDDLVNAASATMTVAATVISCTGHPTIPNTASISAGRPNDPNPENNKSRAVISPTSGVHCLYLPIIFKNYLPPPLCITRREDAFDDPSSGWITGIYQEASYSYVPISSPNEYNIYSKQDRDIRSASPFGSFSQYTVKVEARWANMPLGDEYGIVFGIKNKDSQRVIQATSLYRFVVNTRKNREFLLRRYDSSVGWYTIVGWIVDNASINGDTDLNTLEVKCYGSSVSIHANGNLLWYHDDLPCSGEVGLTSNPSSGLINTNARFDNFEICGQPIVRSSNSDIGVLIPDDFESSPKD